MLPSEWATVHVSYGEGKKHLYAKDRASLEFHANYADAMSAARKSLEDGTTLVAILQVNKLVKVRTVELEEIT